MSRTIKDSKITKKQLVTDPIHRKAGSQKKKENSPKVCMDCSGVGIMYWSSIVWGEECPRCGGTGVIYE